MAVKFYRCAHCGNIIYKVLDSGVPVVCCGQKMEELIPGTTDGAVEKHVPAVSVEGKTVSVKVGSVEHPMVEAHYIQWIALETKKGVSFRHLSHTNAPEAVFVVAEDDEPVAVYEYCNLHGLWKAEV
jgi:superoxide reductase